MKKVKKKGSDSLAGLFTNFNQHTKHAQGYKENAVCSQCGASVEIVDGVGQCPYCKGKIIKK